jgi:hypothetical protein
LGRTVRRDFFRRRESNGREWRSEKGAHVTISMNFS